MYDIKRVIVDDCKTEYTNLKIMVIFIIIDNLPDALKYSYILCLLVVGQICFRGIEYKY